VKIVFSTTCKGRSSHLAETLPQNLAGNPNSTFVVLDYGDGPELRAVVDANRCDRLKVYRHNNGAAFHVAHAKNMAHRLAIREGADILVTLDADNFTGEDFEGFVAEKMKEPGVFLCPDHAGIRELSWDPDAGRPNRGFAGRLAVRAQDFIKAGGYDENYDTWRGEDIDFNARMGRMGYQMRFIPNQYLKTIPHSAAVRFKEYPHAQQFDRVGAWKIDGDYPVFDTGRSVASNGRGDPVVLGRTQTTRRDRPEGGSIALALVVLVAILVSASAAHLNELSSDASLRRSDVALIGVAPESFEHKSAMHARRFVSGIVISHQYNQPELNQSSRPYICLAKDSVSAGKWIGDVSSGWHKRTRSVSLNKVRQEFWPAFVSSERLKLPLNVFVWTPYYKSQRSYFGSGRFAKVFEWNVNRVAQVDLVRFAEIKSEWLDNIYGVFRRDPRAKTFLSGVGLPVSSINTLVEVAQGAESNDDSEDSKNGQHDLTGPISFFKHWTFAFAIVVFPIGVWLVGRGFWILDFTKGHDLEGFMLLTIGLAVVAVGWMGVISLVTSP
jgi:N-terminal domain of galactosyltransferase